ASKVPTIGVGFWGIKLLTTAMGEATSDFFVHHFSPPLVVIMAGLVFLASLWWQFSRPRYQTLPYWFSVVMVSVFGTMCADVAHVGFGIAYSVSTAVFAVVLAAIFLLWHRVEGTLSIHSITTPRRELFYWLTVTTTFALGTATGDLTAVDLHLGYFASGVIFTGLIVLPGVAYRVAGANSVATFWISYVLTRPLGASYADWLGVSHARGGLNWGPGNVALLFSLFIVVGVLALARAQRMRNRDFALG
ncbi:MAG: hypothetical protein PXZ08_09910, partial [Actinomycetota bacterium]|nr:hypothetical protein [Actinomycetota bacterium]